MSEPLWLTFVLRRAAGLMPVILIQPGSAQDHEPLVRLCRGEGFKRMSPAEWQRWAFTAAMPVQVDVSDGLLARVHFAGVAKSVVPADEQPMTALWMVTAAAMPRVLVVVAAPGSFDGPVPEAELDRLLLAAAGRRGLWAGLAEFHVDRVRRVAGSAQVQAR